VATPPDQVIDAARCILLQAALLEIMPLSARAQQLSEDKPLHNARLTPFMLRFFANANACFGKMQTREHFMVDVFDGRLFCALLARGSAYFAPTATSQLADNTYDMLCRVVLGDLCQVPTPRQTAPVIRATPGKKTQSLTVIQSEVAKVSASCVTINCALYCADLVCLFFDPSYVELQHLLSAANNWLSHQNRLSSAQSTFAASSNIWRLGACELHPVFFQIISAPHCFSMTGSCVRYCFRSTASAGWRHQDSVQCSVGSATGQVSAKVLGHAVSHHPELARTNPCTVGQGRFE